MKSIAAVLWPEYYRILSGNIVLDGNVIPVFDGFAPFDTNTESDYKFILFNQGASRPRFNKCNFEGIYSATVEICCGYFGATAGFKDADAIEDEVLQLLCPYNVHGYFITEGFEVVSSSLAQSSNLTDNTGTHFEYRKLLRIDHIYSQIVNA